MVITKDELLSALQKKSARWNCFNTWRSWAQCICEPSWTHVRYGRLADCPEYRKSAREDVSLDETKDEIGKLSALFAEFLGPCYDACLRAEIGMFGHQASAAVIAKVRFRIVFTMGSSVQNLTVERDGKRVLLP
jgi:hypothetical protein